MSGNRDPIDATLDSHLSMRLTRLAEDRDIQLDRLMDKSVELLLEYMEDHEVLNDHVKLNNVEAINKNREIILQSRQLLKNK